MKYLLSLILSLVCWSSLAVTMPTGTNLFIVSSKGIANGLSAIKNNGALWGPDSAGTTTSGLQEAINACITATSLTVPPAGGGVIHLEPGTYLCTSTINISNRFSNPITIEGISDAPSTIIQLRPGDADGITTTAPVNTGNLELNLRNLVLAYEGIRKRYICNFTDVQRFFCENVYFTTWGFVTNGGLGGNVFSSYASAHGASVVGVKLGTFNSTDSPFGLAQFRNCRWADLACGGISTIDHVWLDKPHALLIGGNNRNTPSTNNWAVGGSFTVPDSMFALHPFWVNYAVGGDVQIDDPRPYYTYALLLHAKQGSIGHPLIRNTTASGLEGSTWIALEYDDMNTANDGNRIDIEAEPHSTLLGCISLVKKPGTISLRFPQNVRVFKAGSFVSGSATNFTLTRGSAVGDQPGFEAGVWSGGVNRFYGTNLIDQINAGITINMASIAVAGGTDAGINGTYFLSDRMFVDSPGGGSPSLINTFSWTNAAYAVVMTESAASLNGGNGAIYALGDSNMLNTLYDCNGTNIYPGYTAKVGGGLTLADTGVGTPPTVKFTLTTNLAFFAGNTTVGGNLTVSGNSTLNNTTSSVLNVSGQIRLLSPTNATTIVNLGLDANGNISSNAVPVGGSGSTPTFNANQFSNGSGTDGTNIISGSRQTNNQFYGNTAFAKSGTLVASNSVQIGSPATADSGQLLLYSTNGHLSRLQGVNAEGVDQTGFSIQEDSLLTAFFSTNHFKFLKTITITNTDGSIITSPTNLIEILTTNGGFVVVSNDASLKINGSLKVTGSGTNGMDYIVLTNGWTSIRSNLLAPTSITAPATTVNWTNPIDSTIEVYIDNSGVTGTAIKKNNTTIFTSLVGDVTIGLQSGEYISLTYTIGTPSIKWSPR